jgi:hypothetical protein
VQAARGVVVTDRRTDARPRGAGRPPAARAHSAHGDSGDSDPHSPSDEPPLAVRRRRAPRRTRAP